MKTVYLVPCGHVFAEEAIRQLKGEKCLQVSVFCYSYFAKNNKANKNVSSATNPTPKKTSSQSSLPKKKTSNA
jgi:hypothetical protein